MKRVGESEVDDWWVELSVTGGRSGTEGREDLSFQRWTYRSLRQFVTSMFDPETSYSFDTRSKLRRRAIETPEPVPGIGEVEAKP